MYIQLSELKTNPAKYFDLAKTCEEKLNAFNEIMRCLKEMPSVSDDTVYDEVKEARLKERGLIERI